MTVGSAAEFHPAKPKPGSSGAPGLRRAALEFCDPLPINASAEGYKGKKNGKMTPIRQGKTSEKGLRPLGHRSVKLGFDFCFQQNVYGGWVSG
jgi:hypothetical protein